MTSRPSFVATILLTAVIAASCGARSSQAPSDTVKRFISALKSSDGRTACSLLTAKGKAQFVTGSKPCEPTVKALGSLLGLQLTNAEIGSATVHGNSATVPVSTPSKHATYRLERTGGRWLISGH